MRQFIITGILLLCFIAINTLAQVGTFPGGIEYDSTVTVKLTDRYNKGKFVRYWMGDNYRDVWNTEVEFPVFDITKVKGGLTILKRGGGQQTRSVRLEAENGKQYVLRSVNKFVEKALEEEMRNTIAEDVVQDAISASQPYGAITVPPLADAVGVFHTNPQLVYVPDDPNLGEYRKDLKDGIFLFEERPDDDRSDVAGFGFSEDIRSTPKTIEKQLEEQDHVIDQKSVIRARLLDLLLNDWDRHDDQWRWATFKNDSSRVYKPIPRDRDQVYFVNQGPVLWLASQNFLQPKFQGFGHTIKNPKGLGYNSRYFDRFFITEPDLKTWLDIAGKMQQQLTDEVIDEAMKRLPPPVYDICGKDIASKLKSRRDKLNLYAAELYYFISREVDVVGTQQRELFEINRLDSGKTKVEIFALSHKKGKVQEKLYSRTFYPDETNEIRLYGLEGMDKFVVNGDAKKAIKLRIIGGPDNDSILNYSNIRGCGKTIKAYDRKDQANYLLKGTETRKNFSRKANINEYDREQYKFDRVMPLVSAGYNIDDGINIGGGVLIKNYNFRDSTRHKITGKAAFETGAFAVKYSGYFSSFSRYFDLEINSEISAPRNVGNYFGAGNETEKLIDEEEFYHVRYEYRYLDLLLYHHSENIISYSVGPFVGYFETTDTSGRFIANPEISGIDPTDYDEQNFTGLMLNFTLDSRDDELLPSKGILWETDASAFFGLNTAAENFSRFKSDIRWFLSFTEKPHVVFALRFGGLSSTGKYPFYQSAFLGGASNLRGFRANRFAGDHALYQNTEIRIKLSDIRSYFLNGQTGFYLFHDIGRVWVEDEKSNKWHNGYGAGFWVTPFEFTALTLSYSRSKEDGIVRFDFRFLF